MLATTERTTTRDQACRLRALIDHQADHVAPAEHSHCRTIAVASGKGGVGKSVIALNLAVAMAQRGQRVGLIDANLGLGSLDVLCGLSGYWNLSHVVSGARTLEQITLTGPAGIHIIPGGSGIIGLADCPANVQEQLLHDFETLERDHDMLVIDTGSGIHRMVRMFAQAADEILVVTTPETTSITNAYAAIKSLNVDAGPEMHVIVNQAESAEHARRVLERIHQTAWMFLRVRLGLSVWLPHDDTAPQSVASRQPFMTTAPASPVSRGIEHLADQLLGSGASSAGSYFSRLARKLLSI